MVCCCSFLWCRTRVGKLLEELEHGLAEASVRLEGDRCHREWVVFAALLGFGDGVGVAWCNRNACGTRQGSSCCGGGDHYAKVECLSSGEEGDVGPVELAVVLAVRRGVWVGDDDLLGQGTVPGDRENEVNKSVS